MTNHLKRSSPFILTLLKVKPSSRAKLLHTFPTYVIDDIIEILYNVIHRKVPISAKRQNVLLKHKNPILRILNSGKSKRRQILYKQRGGFLGALLPILSGVLGAVIANA